METVWVDRCWQKREKVKNKPNSFRFLDLEAREFPQTEGRSSGFCNHSAAKKERGPSAITGHSAEEGKDTHPGQGKHLGREGTAFPIAPDPPATWASQHKPWGRRAAIPSWAFGKDEHHQARGKLLGNGGARDGDAAGGRS